MTANRKHSFSHLDRGPLAASLAVRYGQGASLRALVEEFGLPYTTVRSLAIEGGAVMRGRGGDNRSSGA